MSWRVLLCSAAGAGLVVSGCALAGGDRVGVVPDAGSGRDASGDTGPLNLGDAAPSDAGLGDADPSPGRGEFDYDDMGGVRAGACFDGVDNNADALTDCDDLSCQQNVATCCVGASSAACCTPETPVPLPIADCSGDFSSCAAAQGYRFFGSPSSEIAELSDEHAFIPRGQASDSGLIFDESIDPRRGAAHIQADIGVSEAVPSNGELDVIGVGFVDAELGPSALELGGLERVPLVAGVRISSNREQITLIVLGEVAGRWSIPAARFTVELTITTDGYAQLTVDTSRLATVAVQSPGLLLRGALFGRSPNPAGGDPDPNRAYHVERWTERCDIPSALDRAPNPIVAGLSAHEVRGPSVLTYDASGVETTAMALWVDGDIYLASPGPGGYVLDTALGSPALQRPGDAWAEGGVSNPTLTHDGSALWLWFTAFDANGVGSIARARWDALSAQFQDAEQIDGLSDGTTSYEAIAPFSFNALERAIVARRVDGATELALYALDSAVGASYIVTLRTEATGDLTAFDRDELAAPSVWVHDGVARVYFAGRRSSRWSIGMMASEDLALWNLPDEPVLQGSGAGFDAIGVSYPMPRLEDASGEAELAVYYTGFGGAGGPQIGRAVRPAP